MNIYMEALNNELFMLSLAKDACKFDIYNRDSYYVESSEFPNIGFFTSLKSKYDTAAAQIISNLGDKRTDLNAAKKDKSGVYKKLNQYASRKIQKIAVVDNMAMVDELSKMVRAISNYVRLLINIQNRESLVHESKEIKDKIGDFDDDLKKMRESTVYLSVETCFKRLDNMDKYIIAIKDIFSSGMDVVNDLRAEIGKDIDFVDEHRNTLEKLKREEERKKKEAKENDEDNEVSESGDEEDERDEEEEAILMRTKKIYALNKISMEFTGFLVKWNNYFGTNYPITIKE